VRARDHRGILGRLQEPELGDPIVAHNPGRRISQDLGNSVHELYSATAALPRGVLELGGGYGRVAWAMLEEFPHARYVVCDIPPALAVAQRYLTELFADRPAFRFRHFDSQAEVAEELGRAQLVFLTPNQLALLDPLDIELFVSISSLHEMRPEQISHYIEPADRHTRGLRLPQAVGALAQPRGPCRHRPRRLPDPTRLGAGLRARPPDPARSSMRCTACRADEPPAPSGLQRRPVDAGGLQRAPHRAVGRATRAVP